MQWPAEIPNRHLPGRRGGGCREGQEPAGEPGWLLAGVTTSRTMAALTGLRFSILPSSEEAHSLGVWQVFINAVSVRC